MDTNYENKNVSNGCATDKLIDGSNKPKRRNQIEWNQFGLAFDTTKSSNGSSASHKEETKELFEHEQEVIL